MGDRVPLNPRERTIYAALERAAAAGQGCPSNGDICDMLDIHSVGAASDLISRIAAKGWIKVTRYQSSRIVEIVATGERTAGAPGPPLWRDASGRKRSAPTGITKLERRRQLAAASIGLARSTPAESPPSAPVDRDPCFKCGVRGDIGCRHRRVAA